MTQRYLLPTLLAMLIMMLAACTSNQASNGDNNSAPERASEVRTVEHGLGQIEIPASPQRIVAIQYTGAMLALGVKPVGADNEWAVYPTLAEESAGIEHIGDPWTGLNLEKITALDPDLIITHVEATYEELSKIAPTLWIPWLQYSPPQQIDFFGDILDRREEADQWLNEFDEKVQAARTRVHDLIGDNQTVAIVNLRPQNQFIYGDKAMGGYVIYELLGLRPTDRIQQEVLDQGLGQLEFSLELLPEYANADYLMLSILENDGGAERAQEIMSSELWNNLPAVKADHVIGLEWNQYFTTDPLSTMKQLDSFVNLLQTSLK